MEIRCSFLSKNNRNFILILQFSDCVFFLYLHLRFRYTEQFPSYKKEVRDKYINLDS